MPGHKSYAMRFLADFAPETFERSGRKSLTQALMRFLTDSVLETFEKHGLLALLGRGQRPAQKGDAGTQLLCHEVPGWLRS